MQKKKVTKEEKLFNYVSCFLGSLVIIAFILHTPKLRASPSSNGLKLYIPVSPKTTKYESRGLPP